MTTRPHGNCSVTSTDVLIAMLSHDLRGSWGGSDLASRRRDPRELPDAAVVAVDAAVVDDAATAAAAAAAAEAAAAMAAAADTAVAAAAAAAAASELGAAADRGAPAR